MKLHKTFVSLSDQDHSTVTIKSSLQIPRKFYRINRQKLVEYHSNFPFYRKSMSTQTIFNKQVQISRDSIHPRKSLLQQSEIDIDYSSSSSISSNTTSETSNIMTESKEETDFPDDLHTKVSLKTNSNENHEFQFSDYIPKSRSTNSRIYIRSIYEYMFGNEG